MTNRWTTSSRVFRSVSILLLVAVGAAACSSTQPRRQDSVVSLVYDAVSNGKGNTEQPNSRSPDEKKGGILGWFGGSKRAEGKPSEPRDEPRHAASDRSRHRVTDGAAEIKRYPTTKYEYRLSPGDELIIDFYKGPFPLDGEAHPYRVMPMDILRISVEGQRMFAQDVTVRSDGNISFFLIKDLQVAGLTVPDIRQRVARELAEITPSADISVLLVEGHVLIDRFLQRIDLSAENAWTAHSVRPDGSLNIWGVGDINVNGMTVSRVQHAIEDSLAARFGNGIGVTIRLLQRRPNSAILGEVRRPGMYPLYEPVHPLYALALAGDRLDTANYEKIILLKKRKDGSLDRHYINLKTKHIAESRGREVLMEPEDILIVPKTGIANVNLWVDQYIRRLLPIPAGAGVSYGVSKSAD